MLSLDQIRKIDPRLNEVNDTNLEQLRDSLYDAAQLAFDTWWIKKNGSKNPVGLFQDKEPSGTLPLWTPEKRKTE